MKNWQRLLLAGAIGAAAWWLWKRQAAASKLTSVDQGPAGGPGTGETDAAGAAKQIELSRSTLYMTVADMAARNELMRKEPAAGFSAGYGAIPSDGPIDGAYGAERYAYRTFHE